MTKPDEQDSKRRSHADQTPELAHVERELDREYERMQRPGQREAVDELFSSDSNALGQAALDAARSRGR